MNESFYELATYLQMDAAQIDEVKPLHGVPIRLLKMSTARAWIFSDGFRLTIPVEG